MHIVLYIIALLLSGLIIGALARLLVPGKDPMSLGGTILIGIAGSFVAGLVAYYLFHRQAGPGIILSIICTMILVYIVRKSRERSRTGH